MRATVSLSRENQVLSSNRVDATRGAGSDALQLHQAGGFGEDGIDDGVLVDGFGGREERLTSRLAVIFELEGIADNHAKGAFADARVTDEVFVTSDDVIDTRSADVHVAGSNVSGDFVRTTASAAILAHFHLLLDDAAELMVRAGSRGLTTARAACAT